MTEMTMLDLDAVDLGDIALALEDHSDEYAWWLDPETGELHYLLRYDRGAEDADPEELGWLFIHPIDSSEGYRDMEEFIARVRDPRARDLLARAIEGRGAFRRFKDTLFEFPEVREAWFAFHDRRMHRRAVEWLLDWEVVAPAQANAALDELQDPDLPELAGSLDAEAVAAEVADTLGRVYGRRLRQVLLFGSWARGDADAESDLDLLVVIDGMESPFAEIDRMQDMLWPHSLTRGVAISVVPVSAAEWRGAATAFLERVKAEGLTVA